MCPKVEKTQEVTQRSTLFGDHIVNHIGKY